MGTLTTKDLKAALADERHGGWGLATIYRERPAHHVGFYVSGEMIADEIIAAANARGWDRETLFHYANSNVARYALEASFCVLIRSPQRVREIFDASMDDAARFAGVLDGTAASR